MAGYGQGYNQQITHLPPGAQGGYQQGYQQPPHGTHGHQANQNHFSANACYGQYQSHFRDVFSQQMVAWQAMQFQTEEEFANVFHQHANPALNAIQGEELCKILNTTPLIKNYYRISWSLELCKIMMAMLDRSKDGLMQFAEFRELLQCLVYWHHTFCQFDANRSGFIEAPELFSIIKNKYMYNLSPKAMETILKRYSKLVTTGGAHRTLIAFDDFVALSVRLRAYTEAFRARDRAMHQQHETGETTFGYDDFLQCVMCL